MASTIDKSIPSLCPKCNNNDPHTFEVREMFSTDDTEIPFQYVKCEVCGESILMDPMVWEELVEQHLAENATRHRRSQERKLAKKADNDRHLPQYVMSYMANIPEQFKEKSEEKDKANGQNGMQIVKDTLQDKEQRSMLMSYMFSIPCDCGNHDWAQFKVISDSDDVILARHCDICGRCSGVDDSISVDEASSKLQQSQLKTSPCVECGNDDPYNFIFEENTEGNLILRCQLCGHSIQDAMAEGNLSTDLDDIQLDIDVNGRDDFDLECSCGNKNGDLVQVHYGRSGAPVMLECLICEQFIYVENSQHGEVSEKGLKMSEGDLENQLPSSPRPIGRTQVKNLANLDVADHIAWHQSLAYWHHAIVVKVSNLDQNKMRVIHYNGPATHLGCKGVITEEWVEVDFAKDALYQVNYIHPGPAELVLERARSRQGERNYNLMTNNCEHFARWSKTGVEESDQVEGFKDSCKRVGNKVLATFSKDSWKQGIKIWKRLRQAKAPNIFNKSWLGWGKVSAYAASAENNAVGDAASAMAGKEVAEVGGSFVKADMVGIGVVVAIEGFSVARDVFKTHRQMKNGEIGKGEYMNVVLKRVSQGTGGITGSVAGGLVGQTVLPVPIVGGFIGASLGSFLGEGLGMLVGRKLVKRRQSSQEK